MPEQIHYFFRRLQYLAIILSYAVLSYIVPKKIGLVVFYPRHRSDAFEGNLKSLFLYMHAVQTRYTPCWLTSNPELAGKLSKQGYNCRLYKYKPLWMLLRAEYVVLDTGYEIIFAFGRFKLIQLWHGSGFKQLGMLKIKYNNKNRRWQSKQHLAYICMKSVASKFLLVTAASDADAHRKKDSWNSKNIVITGAARNDVFFNPKLLPEGYKTSLGIEANQRIILYAPTFVKKNPLAPFSNHGIQQLDMWLAQTNSCLLLKAHPRMYDFLPQSSSPRIINVTHEIEDMQELLAIADVLITDYSSVSTDFSLRQKPIIFYLFHKEYLHASQNFYYPPDEYLPGPTAMDETQLMALLSDLSWFDDAQYQKKFRAFMDMFHYYRDANSSQRTLAALEDL